jgi:hypothetical protein
MFLFFGNDSGREQNPVSYQVNCREDSVAPSVSCAIYTKDVSSTGFDILHDGTKPEFVKAFDPCEELHTYLSKAPVRDRYPISIHKCLLDLFSAHTLEEFHHPHLSDNIHGEWGLSPSE